MKLADTYTFNAPREAVWQALLDPEVLARVMPGCERLEKIGDNTYKGMLKIRIGPVQGKFQGKVTLSDMKEPESYTLQIDGKGAPGFMKGKGEVRLEDQGPKTLMHYTGEGQVGGRIASVGQRLMESSAKALTRQSLDNLHRQIQARVQAEAAPPTHSPKGDQADGAAPAQTSAPALPPVEAPSQMDFAAGVAKNLLEDLVPPAQRPLVMGGMALLLVGFLLNWWATVIARRTADEILRRRG